MLYNVYAIFDLSDSSLLRLCYSKNRNHYTVEREQRKNNLKLQLIESVTTRIIFTSGNKENCITYINNLNQFILCNMNKFKKYFIINDLCDNDIFDKFKLNESDIVKFESIMNPILTRYNTGKRIPINCDTNFYHKYVYIITSRKEPDICYIGVTSGNPQYRLDYHYEDGSCCGEFIKRNWNRIDKNYLSVSTLFETTNGELAKICENCMILAAKLSGLYKTILNTTQCNYNSNSDVPERYGYIMNYSMNHFI